MMKHLYEIYEICEKNECSDLTFALAMFHAEHPGVIPHEEDKAIRLFIGRNNQELAAAYRPHDQAHFDAVVAKLIAKETEVE